jgi:hypothetical protein
MHHYLQRKTAYAIARGEEPPWGGLYAPGGFYAPPADPCVANPPTKKLPRKLNLRRHIARMAEVCHFVFCCSLSCRAVIFELLFRLNHGN